MKVNGVVDSEDYLCQITATVPADSKAMGLYRI